MLYSKNLRSVLVVCRADYYCHMKMLMTSLKLEAASSPSSTGHVLVILQTDSPIFDPRFCGQSACELMRGKNDPNCKITRQTLEQKMITIARAKNTHSVNPASDGGAATKLWPFAGASTALRALWLPPITPPEIDPGPPPPGCFSM